MSRYATHARKTSQSTTLLLDVQNAQKHGQVSTTPNISPTNSQRRKHRSNLHIFSHHTFKQKIVNNCKYFNFIFF